MNPIGPRNLQLNCSISALGASRAGVSQNNASIQEEESHENESKGHQESDDGDLSLDDMLDPLEQFRTSILGRVTVLFVIQIALSVLVIWASMHNTEVGGAVRGLVSTLTPKADTDFCGASCQWSLIVIARFICGMVMHVSLQGELLMGMSMMKYSANHPWKFLNWKQAYLAGLLQTVTVVVVEIVNLVAIL